MKDCNVLAYMASIFSQFLYNPPKEEMWEDIKEKKILLEWFIHSNSTSNVQANLLWKESHFKEDYLELAVDYTDLFICDEISLKAPPYGSYYLDISGELYSRESDNVKSLYNQCSFFTDALFGQPADFIAIELEFLSTLLFNLEKDATYKEALKIFLEENFLPWVGVWAKDLQSNAKSSFYKGLGFHIQNFCEILIEEFCINNYEKKILRRAS
ncbi:TorD/DmsD family molecular chaperone [Halarcobacter ebronensis]|uniref:Molecular chaperone TorD n=1 Tax=Halarcobacter ebronensis TaxID=1462615 RepID=A0A4Q1AXD8_9BACT|nr:molecular chaperone TorD family protein [Halarcobacter ebronensis]QKF83261.1 putative dimethyl sulfoxide reductase chaperone DmsD [Halarcobacter ebronensis]RXK05825.1 hypothetical protein CRV07_07050 [Halarcobacter ebronensis]